MMIAMQNVFYSRQTTNTASALEYLREIMFSAENGDRSNYRDIAVLITDGESNNKDETLSQAVLTKSGGIHVVTVGIGNWLDMNELENMASYLYSDNLLHVENFAALPSLLNMLRDSICGSEYIGGKDRVSLYEHSKYQ